MADWKKGDLVELKSGGPPMTVNDIHNNGKLYCFWFDGTEQKNGLFNPETVKPSPQEGDG